MRVRVLGSAAGGGFPQWNCRCGTCEAARAGVRARPRTQSSLAIRGVDGPWFLVNASPDARQQLETLTPSHVDGVRASPIAGVLLTDAEIDHTAGLLLLRESPAPLRVFGGAGVEHALKETLLRMLERFCGVDWTLLEPEREMALEESSLVVETFQAGDDEATGFVFRDRASGGVVTYVPGARQIGRRRDRPLRRQRPRARGRDVLAQRTSSPGWASPTAARTTWATCRSPALAGRSRRLPAWSVRARCSCTSTTRTRSCSRTLLSASRSSGSGVEVAYDGLEVEL